MQGAVINIAFGTVLVFLFGTVVWVRQPDDRTRCWFAGWLSMLGAFIAQFVSLHAAGWKGSVAAAVELDLIAIAGIFFVVSAAIPVRGRGFGIRLCFELTIPTVLCLTLASAGVQSQWLLLLAVAARQTPLIAMSSTVLRIRPRFGLTLISICTFDAGLMFYFILHGQPRLLAPVVLTELYFAAGIDTWNKNIGQTIGMRVSSIGLLICAVVFPLAEVAHRIWPHITTDSEMWNPPKSVIAVGMMLMVFEEEVRAARTLGRDYRLLFENNPNPLWIFDVESLHFLAANDAASAMHGYTKEEFLQLRMPDILHPDVRENVIRRARLPKPASNPTARHRRKDGSDFPVDISSHSVIFQGKPCRFVLGLDVTKRESLERKLEYQLYHDALTGLANRRSFEEQLIEAVDQTMKTGDKLAILCFDIYQFKRLNEVYSPRIGDECVQYVANVLNARTRAMDFVARTGDDEFAIVLTDLSNVSPAQELAAYLNESFQAPILIGGYEIQLSFSLGLAVCPDDGRDPITLWHLAQTALRRAQSKGRGQTVWLSPELRAEAEKNLEIATTMNRLLEEGYFHLVYQPLYANDGSVRGMEALLRLNHPRYGSVSPLSVIRTAEESGTIELLGQWVFERACQHIKIWMDEGIRLEPVALNVSSLQLMRRGFAERLTQTLERYGVNPRLIHLEITETVAMDNLKAVSNEMRILSGLGYRFSIDDFGTGHSSLARLHQLPISILKIDRSFIVNLCKCDGTGGDSSETIVQAILSMAHTLGLQVVAEGVETDRQLNCLRRLGCDFYQGFLLSRPVRPGQIPGLMTGTHPAFGRGAKGTADGSGAESSEEDRISMET